MFPVVEAGGDKVMRHRPPIVQGADVSKWRRPRDHKGGGGVLLLLLLLEPVCFSCSVGTNQAMQFFHVPPVSCTAFSWPFPQVCEDAFSSTDEPSAPTQKIAGCAYRITPRKM